ncbi:ADP-ribosyltransferase [Bacillus cereus]|uniref:ADP-ribosyltransferase n=1 Tax=Bacillus cereus group TaxID=86661 RepID=UPI0014828675|nr:ADP-ribosyltransferase [Bacillus thuringiensis]MED3275006.1 ADP-ribosyltransferase [Bacillus thuringiensis]
MKIKKAWMAIALSSALGFTGIATTCLPSPVAHAASTLKNPGKKQFGKNFGKNKIEAETWGDATFSTWINGLTPDEKTNIKSYAGSGYQDINEYLLQTKGVLSTNKKLNTKIQTLDQALDKAVVPEDITVYRRVTDMQFGINTDIESPLRAPGQKQIDRAVLRKIEGQFYGKEFLQEGYMSTSLSQDPHASFSKLPILLAISVPAGTKAGFIDTLSGYSQVELLLKRGYKFLYNGFDIEEDDNGTEYMVVDVMLVG